MATEWFDLDSGYGGLRVIEHGEEIGDFQVDREAALVVWGDEMSVVEGSFDNLLRQLRRAVIDVESLKAQQRNEIGR